MEIDSYQVDILKKKLENRQATRGTLDELTKRCLPEVVSKTDG